MHTSHIIINTPSSILTEHRFLDHWLVNRHHRRKMCIAVFMWQAHPLYPFLLLLNRDEYHNRQVPQKIIKNRKYVETIEIYFVVFVRPTKPVGWWEGGEMLGGKDEVAGGTWLACSKHGRVGFLTNVLELHTLPEAKSRGDLVIRFLEVTYKYINTMFLMQSIIS